MCWFGFGFGFPKLRFIFVCYISPLQIISLLGVILLHCVFLWFPLCGGLGFTPFGSRPGEFLVIVIMIIIMCEAMDHMTYVSDKAWVHGLNLNNACVITTDNVGAVCPPTALCFFCSARFLFFNSPLKPLGFPGRWWFWALCKDSVRKGCNGHVLKGVKPPPLLPQSGPPKPHPTDPISCQQTF